MNPIALFGQQIKWEQKMFWRNPIAAAFTFVFPIIFLVIFSAIQVGVGAEVLGPGVAFTQYYVPAILVFGVLSACYTQLAITIALRRLQGVLKRKRGTPLRPSVYLAGIIVNSFVVTAILAVLTLGIGVVFYDFTFPDFFQRAPDLALVIGACAFCFSAAGILISTFPPNQDAAPALVNVVVYPIVFISGTFGPISDSSILTKVAQVFPIWHGIRITTRMLNPLGDGSYNLSSLLFIVAWGVATTAYATFRFKWDN